MATLCSQPTISRLDATCLDARSRLLQQWGVPWSITYCHSFRHVPRRIVLDYRRHLRRRSMAASSCGCSTRITIEYAASSQIVVIRRPTGRMIAADRCSPGQ